MVLESMNIDITLFLEVFPVFLALSISSPTSAIFFTTSPY